MNQDFFDFWQQMPRDKGIPDKADFFPEEIPKLLPFLSIYEMVSKDLIRFRLHGSQFTMRDGVERIGKNFLDEVSKDRRAKASEAIWLVYKHPCVMRVILNFSSSRGNVKCVETLGVPIKDYKRGTAFVYFSTQEIERNKYEFLDELDQLENISPLQRDYIDIGAGIPDFKD